MFAPSLTGIGERVHLTSPQVDLSTHIFVLVNQVLYEDLTDIVLLGFSYGGFVVTGALRHIGGRVRHLVYLDAFVPCDGDTVVGLVGRSTPSSPVVGEPWLVPPPPRRFDDPDEAAFMDPRRTPHPSRCITEPVRLSTPLEEFSFSRTYIRAIADAPNAPGTAAFDAAAAKAQRSASWQYREITTNHMVASNRPGELVDLLLKLN